METCSNPGKVPERDIAYNLAKFGYSELGGRLEKGTDICLEYVIASILMKGSARRAKAIPALLAKNSPDYSILFFLCKKYNILGGLLVSLKASAGARKDGGARRWIGVLESMEVRPGGPGPRPYSMPAGKPATRPTWRRS